MVPQVGGDVGVHTGRADVGEEGRRRSRRRPRPGGPAGPGHRRRGRPGRWPAARRRRGRRRRTAAPARAARRSGRGRRRPAGSGRVGDQRTGDAQAERLGEGVGDARVGGVGVGVRDQQRDAVADQAVHDPALEAVGRDRRGPAQIERMVGDQQVRAPGHGLVDDRLDRVDGEQHPTDLGARDRRRPGRRRPRTPPGRAGRARRTGVGRRRGSAPVDFTEVSRPEPPGGPPSAHRAPAHPYE